MKVLTLLFVSLVFQAVSAWGMILLIDENLSTPGAGQVSGGAEFIEAEKPFLLLESGKIKWDIPYKADAFTVEFRVSPRGWDGYSPSRKTICRFKAGGKDYHLFKDPAEALIILSGNEEKICIFPVYNWFKQSWMGCGAEHEWHLVSITASESGLRLYINGLPARALKEHGSKGALKYFILTDGEGPGATGFSDFRFVNMPMGSGAAWERYILFYRELLSR